MNGCKYFVNIHGQYALFYRNCTAKSMPVLIHLNLSGFFLQTVAFPPAMFYNDYRMPKSCKHQIRRDLGKGRKAVMKNSDCQKMTGHSPFQWRNRGHVHRVLLCKTNRHSQQPASQRGLWGTVGRGEIPLSQSVVDFVDTLKNYQIVLFDLDGTLTDPGVGITNSVAYALKKYGIEVADKTQLYPFIGPPLIDSFEKYYGFSEEEAKHAVTLYREYFREKGIFENEVYDGIAPMLEHLTDNGKTLIVATSKPEIFARQILEHFQLDGCFRYIAGANLDGTRSKKNEVIEYALEACDVTDRSSAVMIGDRDYDIIGAQKTGLDSVGVLYGYGNRAELERAQATYIVKTVADLEQLLLQK